MRHWRLLAARGQDFSGHLLSPPDAWLTLLAGRGGVRRPLPYVTSRHVAAGQRTGC
ncbi:MAG: hypothetical protein L0Y66_20940 [Myxococcaceae bacterium]|nr:hypothetical protein [Myxococcaceae bacterium]MCI0672495.1 hypothetical protein [Myxococcaceae bacterium]